MIWLISLEGERERQQVDFVCVNKVGELRRKEQFGRGGYPLLIYRIPDLVIWGVHPSNK